MNKKELAAVFEWLSRQFPEIRVKLPMVIFPPFQEILRALYFEPAGSDAERFYLWVFFMPLCVPAKYVTFNLGRRIGGKEQRWDLNDTRLAEKLIAYIDNEAIPFLKNVQTSIEAAGFALAIDSTTTALQSREANAYLLARSGEIKEASRSLDILLSLLNLQITWQAEIAVRAQRLKAILINDPEEAKNQLRAWELETIRNLKLQPPVLLRHTQA